MATIKVKQIKSKIGAPKDQKATLAALGLHKIGDVSVQPDNAATQGKIRKISHLLEVTEAEGGTK